MQEQQEITAQSFLTATGVSMLPARERVGLTIEGSDAKDALNRVCEAEDAGVRQVWMTMGGAGRSDTLTFYAAAAIETSKIRLGTSIVQIYPRHPLVMAQQALAVNDLAPNRLRLGVGTSHRHTTEQSFGIKMHSPISYLREYVSVLRGALVEGKVSHHGKFFNVEFTSQRKVPIPILVAALGEKAFRNAGEISDGAISWLCPIPYLLNKARPAFREGANKRQHAPPLVAHVLVALSKDKALVHAAGRKRIEFYSKSPFYVSMFRAAGFPVSEDGYGLDALVDNLVVSGDDDFVKKRILDLLSKNGLDELMIGLVPVSKDEKSERKQLLDLIGNL